MAGFEPAASCSQSRSDGSPDVAPVMLSALLTCYNDSQLWPDVAWHRRPLAPNLAPRNSVSVANVRWIEHIVGSCAPGTLRVCSTPVVATRLCGWYAARLASKLCRARFQAELETTSC